MSTEIAKQEDVGGVPAWMRKASTGASFGNVDASDLKPPRLKVLAGQSPEIMDQVPGAVVGNFWMTIHNVNLGPAVIGSPILLRKSFQLWAPKMPGNEQKGPLATASDGLHWDVPNQTFKVKFPAAQGGGEETWEIKRTVIENGLHKFGSSRPSDPKSKPAATLTYDMLWVIDMWSSDRTAPPVGPPQLCLFTAARTGVGPTQNFISTLRAKGVDSFYQRYRIVVQKKTGPTGDPFFSYEYQYVENVHSEEAGAALRALYDQYSKSGFVTDAQDEESPTRGRDSHYDPQGFAKGQAEADDIPF